MYAHLFKYSITSWIQARMQSMMQTSNFALSLSLPRAEAAVARRAGKDKIVRGQLLLHEFYWKMVQTVAYLEQQLQSKIPDRYFQKSMLWLFQSYLEWLRTNSCLPLQAQTTMYRLFLQLLFVQYC